MTAIFVFCAVVGGTILVCQFVLTLVGFGHDMGGDLAHDFSGDAGGDVHMHAGHDGAAGGHDHDAPNHGSSWLFGVISFRTLVAAFAFFGLAGLATQSGGQNVIVQILIATASGLAAMFGTHYLVKQLGRLGEDSTVRIQRAMGREGTVYIPIPAKKESAGKVQLTLQNRLIEYEAITSGDKLPTGAKVRVTGIRGSVLEVEPLPQEAAAT
jgi:membrane protein implicated in regulation of membrane protease activity